MVVYSVTLTSPSGTRAADSDGNYAETLYTTREMAQKKADILNTLGDYNLWRWGVEEKNIRDSVESLWFYGEYYPYSGKLEIYEGCAYEDIPEVRRDYPDIVYGELAKNPSYIVYEFVMPYDDSLRAWEDVKACVRSRYELITKEFKRTKGELGEVIYTEKKRKKKKDE